VPGDTPCYSWWKEEGKGKKGQTDKSRGVAFCRETNGGGEGRKEKRGEEQWGLLLGEIVEEMDDKKDRQTHVGKCKESVKNSGGPKNCLGKETTAERQGYGGLAKGPKQGLCAFVYGTGA